MTTHQAQAPTLTTVAVFPQHYFLENLAVRADGSTFDQIASGIVEAEPEVFYLTTTNGYTTHESFLHRLDLRGWSPDEALPSECVLEFDERAGGLNGSCLLAPNQLLVADCVSGLIWHVDLGRTDREVAARVWLKFVAGGIMPDDFCIDEDGAVAYVTTHRQNTLDRVPLDPSADQTRRIVVGETFDEQLIGPSSAAWGRGPGDRGRIMYVTTDGGFIAPPPGEPGRRSFSEST